MNEQLKELLLQSLEQELGGIQVYETALECAQNEQLHALWERYLEQTRKHARVLRGVCEELELDPNEETRGRLIVRDLGQALVDAMEQALEGGKGVLAELIAAECVVLAETKDHADWELLAKCAEETDPEVATVLAMACDEIEQQEDEHLYHSKGWSRELWLQALAMKAVLPPPEERQHATTAIGAAKAQQMRDRLT